MGCTLIYHEGANDQLEELLKEQKMIRTLALRHNVKIVQISRDVRLIGRRDFYFTGTVEITAIENMLYQSTTIEYEGLD
jgi:hypothetical protein